jgi:phosphoribosylglycinamide formyltransferase-1
MKLAVFVSGNGSNLQVIIDAIKERSLTGINIEIVIADRNCFALERAKQANIFTYQLDRRSDWYQEVDFILKKREVTHILLAGFLSVIHPAICMTWKNKIINLHPSLLPKYGGKGMYGLSVHQAVILNHENESGATIHHVTEQLDDGKILLQKKCKVDLDETPESLQQKVHLIEHDLIHCPFLAIPLYNAHK